jgi:hypothetical protein
MNTRFDEATRRMWVSTPVLRAALAVYIEQRRTNGQDIETAMEVMEEVALFERAWDERNLPQAKTVTINPPVRVVCNNTYKAATHPGDVPAWMRGEQMELD